MKIAAVMPSGLRPFYRSELQQASAFLANKNYTQAWHHLERAHIFGQPFAIEHTAVHWKMLKFGVRIKNTKEIVGQIPRLLVGGVKSFVGIIPAGNPGGANVPALRSFPIPEDIKHVIQRFQP